MTHTLRTIVGGAVLTILAAGCENSPPGAGFTSGEKPNLTSEEKPAIRDDLRDGQVKTGDASLAESASSSPGTSGNNAGTKSAEAAGNAPNIKSSTENGAPGETKPAGNRNTGTPRSPQ